MMSGVAECHRASGGTRIDGDAEISAIVPFGPPAGLTLLIGQGRPGAPGRGREVPTRSSRAAVTTHPATIQTSARRGRHAPCAMRRKFSPLCWSVATVPDDAEPAQQTSAIARLAARTEESRPHRATWRGRGPRGTDAAALAVWTEARPQPTRVKPLTGGCASVLPVPD